MQVTSTNKPQRVIFITKKIITVIKENKFIKEKTKINTATKHVRAYLPFTVNQSGKQKRCFANNVCCPTGRGMNNKTGYVVKSSSLVKCISS